MRERPPLEGESSSTSLFHAKPRLGLLASLFVAEPFVSGTKAAASLAAVQGMFLPHPPQLMPNSLGAKPLNGVFQPPPHDRLFFSESLHQALSRCHPSRLLKSRASIDFPAQLVPTIAMRSKFIAPAMTSLSLARSSVFLCVSASPRLCGETFQSTAIAPRCLDKSNPSHLIYRATGDATTPPRRPTSAAMRPTEQECPCWRERPSRRRSSSLARRTPADAC